MKSFVDFFLFSALFIACCAVALCMETNLLLGLPTNHWSVYAFVFGATLVQYNLHYFFKPDKPIITERARWTAANRNNQVRMLAIGGLMVLVSLWWLQPRHFLVMVVLAILAALYSFPLLPFRRKRLKEYGGLKIILLSLEWTLVTVWFPVDQTGLDPADFWLVMVRRFIFMWVLCLAFDIRDREVDALDGIRTLPVRWGVGRAYLFTDIALGFFVLLSAWQLARTGAFAFFHAMLLSALCTRIVIQATKRMNNDYLYLAGVDGMMLLQALLVVIGTI
ncbi:UbiA family prenyltransferase [Flavihumibacter rivuli]|uniref:UbiA family prenyltransferase n=1 Tax=Flavihumibacter rivuli TaxID=2838156 RepID=UPI001BDDDED5|nr:UbiA family prenyltransferase [Flavihumibacter rivuli]ULQ57163.1 UbiA family prenyltransferase [Flavihumibacter rivuli]